MAIPHTGDLTVPMTIDISYDSARNLYSWYECVFAAAHHMIAVMLHKIPASRRESPHFGYFLGGESSQHMRAMMLLLCVYRMFGRTSRKWNRMRNNTGIKICTVRYE